MVKILPSIASANQLCIQEELNRIKETPYLHIDVEDGNFVPNITFGLKMIRGIVDNNEFCYDVHLLVNNPLFYLDDLFEQNISSISFHIESVDYPLQLLNKIRKHNIKAGIALNFKTTVDTLVPFTQSLDYVLIMTSEPDDGDNLFNEEILKKIDNVKNIIPKNVEIWVDGGVSVNHLPKLMKAGVDTVIMGRAIWQNDDPISVINCCK